MGGINIWNNQRKSRIVGTLKTPGVWVKVLDYNRYDDQIKIKYKDIEGWVTKSTLTGKE